MRRPTAPTAMLAALALFVAAGCGGADGGAADQVGIGITGTRYDPASLGLPAGPTTIVIANNDPFTHTFTLDDGTIDQEIPAGATIDVVVDLTHTTPFHCRIHPTSMTGTLTVT